MAKSEFDPIMIGLSPDKDIGPFLKLHKADFACLRSGKFDLTKHVLAFQPTLEFSRQDAITVTKQLDGYDSVLSYIDRGKAPVIGISSTPTDDRAKQLALHFMEYYVRKQRENAVGGRPLWHRVYGGYRDKLVEDNPKLGFLVISNFNTESTQAKLEKVRDLIELYPNIPKILVMSGTDPISLISQRLRYSLTHAFYIGSNKTIHRDVMELLDV